MGKVRKPSGLPITGYKTRCFFNDRIKERIKFLAERGLTEQNISFVIGVAHKTYQSWKQKDKDFFEELQAAKKLADTTVEMSLFEQATGYWITKEIAHWDPELKDWQKTEIDVWTPPSTTAQIFWLKNRDPDNWKDRRELQIAAKTVQIERKRFDGSIDDE